MHTSHPIQRHEQFVGLPVKPQVPTNILQSGFTHRSAFSKSLFVFLLVLQLLFDFWVIAPSTLRYVLLSFSTQSEIQAEQMQAANVTQNCGKDVQNGVPLLQSKYSQLTQCRVQQILTEFNHKITYVKSMNTVFVTMPKAGSTTFWQTMFLGFTGYQWPKDCGHVHNQSSLCWNSHITDVLKLSTAEQFRLLSSNHTTRVAIQREPFSRLVSGYKNKIACDLLPGKLTYNYSPILRINANLPPGNLCMNISEFAEVMDIIRTHVGQPGYLKSWSKIDKHFMPQNFYADEIFYHKVFDVEDLSNETKMAPFFDQLPYAKLAKEAKFHKVKTTSETLLIDDKSAQKLHRYAQLAVTIPSQK